MINTPLAYFITFTTFGTWLHGDKRGSIVRKEGTTLLLSGQEKLNRHERQKLKSSPVLLNSSHRKIVLDTIIEHCQIKQWHLYVAHIRSNHVHIVIKSNKSIDHVSKELKAWPTRNLRKEGMTNPKIWTTGSSKKYIFTRQKLLEKIHYVAYEQGKMMECYIDELFKKK